MDSRTLELIRHECEKIEIDPGHGTVLIKIRNGAVYIVQPTPTILMQHLTNGCEKVYSK